MLHTNPEDADNAPSDSGPVSYTPPGTLERVGATEVRAFQRVAEEYSTPLRTFPKEISAAATSRELTPDEVAQFSRWLETGADDAQNAPDADEHFKCLKHAWLSKPYARDLRVTKTHLSTHDWTARMTNAWPIYDILSIERKRGARVIFIELPGSLFRRRSRLEVRLPSDEDAMRLAERLVAAAPDAKALC